MSGSHGSLGVGALSLWGVLIGALLLMVARLCLTGMIIY